MGTAAPRIALSAKLDQAPVLLATQKAIDLALNAQKAAHAVTKAAQARRYFLTCQHCLQSACARCVTLAGRSLHARARRATGHGSDIFTANNDTQGWGCACRPRWRRCASSW